MVRAKIFTLLLLVSVSFLGLFLWRTPDRVQAQGGSQAGGPPFPGKHSSWGCPTLIAPAFGAIGWEKIRQALRGVIFHGGCAPVKVNDWPAVGSLGKLVKG